MPNENTVLEGRINTIKDRALSMELTISSTREYKIVLRRRANFRPGDKVKLYFYHPLTEKDREKEILDPERIECEVAGFNKYIFYNTE